SCHKVQDSLLSSASRFTDYRGIFNWCVIMLVLTHAHLFLENFIQHGFLVDLRKVIQHLVEDNYNWPSVYLILAANVFVVAALLLEKWQEKGFISPRVGRVLEVGNLLVLMGFPAAVILHKSTSITVGGSMLSLCVYTIIALKMYSYHDVNSWYRQGHLSNSAGMKKETKQERREYQDQLTLKDLYYFLLAPTLCYQLDFPRNETIRKNFLFQRLMEMVSKWNAPFHKWSSRHLYRPLIQKRLPPRQAELIVFVMSAAMCEYLIAIPLHMFRLWIFGIMILEIKVTFFLGHYFTGNYGNGMVWLCMLLGPPIAILTYFHDYYMMNRDQSSWILY
ncbi:DGAT1 acyltransferase, partial [Amia calva]|nr:DGAT1 acyltransferase [Amia calva]